MDDCPRLDEVKVFSRMRKCLRQTNGFSDKGTEFAGTDYCGVNAVSQNGKYPVFCKQGAFLLCKNARANKRFHRYSGKVRSGPLSLASVTQVKQWLAQIRADDCLSAR